MLWLFRAGLTSPLSAVVPRAPAPRADFVFVLRRESALGRAGLVRWHQPGSGGGSGTTGRLGRGTTGRRACGKASAAAIRPHAPLGAGSWSSNVLCGLQSAQRVVGKGTEGRHVGSGRSRARLNPRMIRDLLSPPRVHLMTLSGALPQVLGPSPGS